MGKRNVELTDKGHEWLEAASARPGVLVMAEPDQQFTPTSPDQTTTSMTIADQVLALLGEKWAVRVEVENPDCWEIAATVQQHIKLPIPILEEAITELINHELIVALPLTLGQLQRWLALACDAFGNEVRTGIMASLQSGADTAQELWEALDIPRMTMYFHLRKLRDMEFVDGARTGEGAAIHYYISWYMLRVFMRRAQRFLFRGEQ